MKKFYLITNSEKDKDLEVTEQIQKYLTEHGSTYILHVAAVKTMGSYTDACEVPEDTECVIVLGGDGTLIQAARDMVHRDIPILGINLGTVGFLTEVEKDTLFPALDRLMAGDVAIEERMMIKGTVHSDKCVEEEMVALNDIVINRCGPLHILEFIIYVNGEVLTTYQADGVIVATPTGSTGYSLSAGGPIIEPHAQMMLVTPICPHVLNARSIVLSKEDVIRVEVGSNREIGRGILEVTFDGSRSFNLEVGDYVEITCSEQVTKIVKLKKEGFLSILRSKLSDRA